MSLLMTYQKQVTTWGFPKAIVNFYHRKGIYELFEWQVDALNRPEVLEHGRNLVFSAPTSAGKSMVCDFLMYRTLLYQQKKVIIILPFVAVTLERVQSLKQILRRLGFRIDSFAGTSQPHGGLEKVNVAVCTIEKANNMINRLIDEDKLSEIGTIIVDELHMLGDPERGHLLELLLSKLLYVSKAKSTAKQSSSIQIIGMSATIPNLPDIARWLDAEYLMSNYRPVPLYKRIVSGAEVFQIDDSTQEPKLLHKIELSDVSIKHDDAALIYSSIQTITDGHSALVFCPTRAGCENTCLAIARNIWEFGKDGGKGPNASKKDAEIGEKLKLSLDKKAQTKLQALLDSLKATTFGLDKNLETGIRFGVAFHHSGCSQEERALIENAFRDGTVRVLCSTTTLSAGVNLPARRVLISSPFSFKSQLMSVTTYHQMAGRAGRKGIDDQGESMLFCKERDFRHVIASLVCAQLQPIKSCLLLTGESTGAKLSMSGHLKRAILEVIANGTAMHYSDLDRYLQCTYFQVCYGQPELPTVSSQNVNTAIKQVYQHLIDNQLIYCSEESKLIVSPLGKAIISSGVEPDAGHFIFRELDQARKKLSLASDLHLIYQVTPTYVLDKYDSINWEHFVYKIWDKLSIDDFDVAKLIEVKRDYLMIKATAQKVGSLMPPTTDADRETLLKYKRFYISLVLNDLVQEMPLDKVMEKYGLRKGQIQSLQQQAATFAGMLQCFTSKLGHRWRTMTQLIEMLQPRLLFGVEQELIDLMRIPFFTSTLARQLFQRGFVDLMHLVYCKAVDIEETLIATSSFEATQSRDAANSSESGNVDPSLKKLFVINLDKYVTIRELAQLILQEARDIVEAEVGQKLNFDLEQGDFECLDGSSNAASIVKRKSHTTTNHSHTVPSDANVFKPSTSAFSIYKDSHSKSTDKTVAELEHKVSTSHASESVFTIIKDHATDCISDNLNYSHYLDNFLEFDDALTSQTTKNSKQMRVRANSLNGKRCNDISVSPIPIHSDDSLMSCEMEPPNKPTLKRQRSTSSSTFHSSSEDLSVEIDLLIQKNHYKFNKKCSRITRGDSSGSTSSQWSYGDIPLAFLQSFKRPEDAVPPASFQSEITSAVPVESYQLVDVRDEYCCEQMLEELFPDVLQIGDDAALNVAIHCCIGAQKENEEEGLLIDDRYQMRLNDLYLGHATHSRIFHIHLHHMFQYLQSKLAPRITNLDPLFGNPPVASNPNSGFCFLPSQEDLPQTQRRFRFLTYDVKRTLYVLQFGFHLPEYGLLRRVDWHDLSVAIWLLDPEANYLQITDQEPSFDIDALSVQKLAQIAEHFQLVDLAPIHKAQILAQLSEAQRKHSNAHSKENLFKTAMLFHLTGQFAHKLTTVNLYWSYTVIELPARLCLYLLQTQGVQIDHRELAMEQSRLLRYIEFIEKAIFTQVGEEFNLDSPREVANALNKKLNSLLPVTHFPVTKFGKVSKSSTLANNKQPFIQVNKTNKMELIRLQQKYATVTNLPKLIMEWRKLEHAYRGMVLPMQNAIIFNGHLEGYIYGQTNEWSATGRISMQDPNLINVDKDFQLSSISVGTAVQLERGNLELSSWSSNKDSPQHSSSDEHLPTIPTTIQLRHYIKAREHYVLVSADYCQLELRILAHYSKDCNLLATLNNRSDDVFNSIAADWQSIPLASVTVEMRQQAKEICYGIIYRMGNKLLAEKLAVSEAEAVAFRTSFLQRYSRIEPFVQCVIDKCRAKRPVPYVETISQRRRLLPHILSDDSEEQARAERQAVNTMIQGSAADIIKLAMIAVEDGIRRAKLDAALLLQMHDELMYEVSVEEELGPDKFARFLKQQMEKVSSHLNVILPVKVRCGPTWGQLQEFDF